MAKCIDISKDKEKTAFIDSIQKAIQSTNLNFLIGSGCSIPAIDALGNVENEIEELIKDDKVNEAEIKMSEFLEPIAKCTKNLLNKKEEKDLHQTCENYSNFLQSIAKILHKRRSNILQKKATIFTTNYDLFIEHASSNLDNLTMLNDGFCHNPSVNNEFAFSTHIFFQSVFNTGNLYQYKVQIPIINLIKIHGSLNWKIEESGSKEFPEHIIKKNKDLGSFLSKDIGEIILESSIVLPNENKFKETVLNHTFYELLRIYANELDKENTLLISEGFSFSDKHIFSITKRALKNPTLKLIIFCFKKKEIQKMEKNFSMNSNVEIIYSKNKIYFAEFIRILNSLLEDIDKTSDSNNGSKK